MALETASMSVDRDARTSSGILSEMEGVGEPARANRGHVAGISAAAEPCRTLSPIRSAPRREFSHLPAEALAFHRAKCGHSHLTFSTT